ncbi:hypothetical protein SCLCIDRAFT_21879 [Scleroderma citrinum Foug A]|uniref:HAT C-terminal dimerisation domain-containing protein n=1 Tax=Scleroderma citrinum Foug A TaxID=1036808 RepID=A0A0C3AN26_9AGAM|nr:hypothetical protein SCLCIDRAFT_21879 [Scleroderma citrinum Foug A]
MVNFVVNYCIPVNAMVDKQKLGLGDYALDKHEWKVLKDATLFFSHGTPNLAMVIPAMDYIDEVFMTGMLNQQCFDPAICSAVGLAKNTLNKYYSLTNSSKVYRIMMVLHPCYKLDYFKQAKWQAEWINTTHELVHATYRSSYAPCHVQDDIKPSLDLEACEGEACSTNIFDNLPCLNKFKPVRECNKINSYLATGMEDVAPGDALKWWHDQHSKYPQLSRMVLNYLTIPATSINVEQLFSKGCMLGLVKDNDLHNVTSGEPESDQDDVELPEGWDKITLHT